MIAPSRIATAFLLPAIAATAPAYAQSLHYGFDLGVSHARPPADIESDAASYLLGGGRLSTGSLHGSLYAGLNADGNAGSWIAADAAIRSGRALAPWLYGTIALRGAAFSVGDPSPYRALLGRMTPELRAMAGRAHAAIRAYGGLGTSEALDVVSDLWLYGAGGEIGYSIAAVSTGLGADIYESAAGPYTAAYVTAAGSARPFDWYGELRVWDVPDDDAELEVRFAVSLPIDEGWSLLGTGGRSGPDPLLGTPAGASAGLLVSRNFRRTATPLIRIEADAVVFRLKDVDADRVEIAGDFSGWRRIPMNPEDGGWRVRVRVAPGVHHFGFFVDGDWYVPDEAPGQVSDEFGRRNATLVVPPQGDPEPP